MRTNTLGKSGPIVTELGLGTMTFGAETNEAEAFRQLDSYLAAGGTHIDTADVYSGGESERIIGRWLASRRPDNVVLATKARFAPPPGLSGASRAGVTIALDQSLQRLGVDSIDLFYIHGWDPIAAVADTLGALTEAVNAGKIRHVGWSNTTAWQLQRIIDTARSGGFVRPVVFQPQYNLLDRGVEWEVLPLCIEEGIAVCPWSPLGGGWLTGKYQRDTEPTGATRLGEDPSRGVEAYAKRNVDSVWRIIEVATEVAAQTDSWVGHAAIQWLLGRPSVASVLLGARTVAQLEQSLAALDHPLSEEHADLLTKVSAPGLPPYPYGMVAEYCDMDVWERLGTSRG